MMDDKTQNVNLAPLIIKLNKTLKTFKQNDLKQYNTEVFTPLKLYIENFHLKNSKSSKSKKTSAKTKTKDLELEQQQELKIFIQICHALFKFSTQLFQLNIEKENGIWKVVGSTLSVCLKKFSKVRSECNYDCLDPEKICYNLLSKMIMLDDVAKLVPFIRDLSCILLESFEKYRLLFINIKDIEKEQDDSMKAQKFSSLQVIFNKDKTGLCKLVLGIFFIRLKFLNSNENDLLVGCHELSICKEWVSHIKRINPDSFEKFGNNYMSYINKYTLKLGTIHKFLSTKGKEISIKSINALVSLYKELVNRISSINSFNMLVNRINCSISFIEKVCNFKEIIENSSIQSLYIQLSSKFKRLIHTNKKIDGEISRSCVKFCQALMRLDLIDEAKQVCKVWLKISNDNLKNRVESDQRKKNAIHCTTATLFLLQIAFSECISNSEGNKEYGENQTDIVKYTKLTGDFVRQPFSKACSKSRCDACSNQFFLFLHNNNYCSLQSTSATCLLDDDDLENNNNNENNESNIDGETELGVSVEIGKNEFSMCSNMDVVEDDVDKNGAKIRGLPPENTHLLDNSVLELLLVIFTNVLPHFRVFFSKILKIQDKLLTQDFLKTMSSLLLVLYDLQDLVILEQEGETGSNKVADSDHLNTMCLQFIELCLEIDLIDYSESLLARLCHSRSFTHIERVAAMNYTKGFSHYKSKNFKAASRFLLNSCCLYTTYCQDLPEKIEEQKILKRYQALLHCGAELKDSNYFMELISTVLKIARPSLSSFVDVIVEAYVNNVMSDFKKSNFTFLHRSIANNFEFSECILVGKSEFKAYDDLLSNKNSTATKEHLLKYKVGVLHSLLELQKNYISGACHPNSKEYDQSIRFQAQLLIEKAQLVFNNPKLSSSCPVSLCAQAINLLKTRIIENENCTSIYDELASAYLWHALCQRKRNNRTFDRDSIFDTDANSDGDEIVLMYEEKFFVSLTQALDGWCDIIGHKLGLLFKCPFDFDIESNERAYPFNFLTEEDITINMLSVWFLDFEKTYARLCLLSDLCCISNERMYEQSLKLLCLYCHIIGQTEKDEDKWMERECMAYLSLSAFLYDIDNFKAAEICKELIFEKHMGNFKNTLRISAEFKILEAKSELVKSTHNPDLFDIDKVIESLEVKSFDRLKPAIPKDHVRVSILGKRIRAEMLLREGFTAKAQEEFSCVLKYFSMKIKDGQLLCNLRILHELVSTLMSFSGLFSTCGISYEAHYYMLKAYNICKSHYVASDMMTVLTRLCYLEFHMGLQDNRTEHLHEAYLVKNVNDTLGSKVNMYDFSCAKWLQSECFIADWVCFKINESENDLKRGKSLDYIMNSFEEAKSLLDIPTSSNLIVSARTLLAMEKSWIEYCLHFDPENSFQVKSFEPLRKSLEKEINSVLINESSSFCSYKLWSARRLYYLGRILLAECCEGTPRWNGFETFLETNKKLKLARKYLSDAILLCSKYSAADLLNSASIALAQSYGDDPLKTCKYLHGGISPLARKEMKLKEDTLGKGGNILFSQYSVSDKSFSSQFCDKLPNDWSTVMISFDKNTHHVIVSRVRSNQTPLNIRIPLFKDGKDLYNDTTVKFKNILKGMNESLSCKADNRESRKAWWRKRNELDFALSENLREFQDWLGVWRFVLLGRLNIEQENKTLEVSSKIKGKISSILKGNSKKITLTTYQCFLVLESFSELDHTEIKFFLQILCNNLLTKTQLIKIAQLFKDEWEAINDDCASGNLGHVILVLDKNVQWIPWESLPFLRHQPVSRMPSLSFILHLCNTKSIMVKNGINSSDSYYILNPNGDLKETEKTFSGDFERRKWEGLVHEKPDEKVIADALANRDLFVYCGHGGGEKFIKGEAIQKVNCKAVSLLIGCSSGKMRSQGNFEPRGTPLNYILSECPAFLGMLWDVTDKDIDRFGESLFQKWLDDGYSLVEALSKARSSCKLPWLTGAAPVVYGVPIYAEGNECA